MPTRRIYCLNSLGISFQDENNSADYTASSKKINGRFFLLSDPELKLVWFPYERTFSALIVEGEM